MSTKWIPESGDIVKNNDNRIYVVVEGEIQKGCYYLVRGWKYYRGFGKKPFTINGLQKYKKVGHMPDIQKYLDEQFLK